MASGHNAKGSRAKEQRKTGKVRKVMGEFKRGTLHSGSKKGPKVTKLSQARAIAMSEAGMPKFRGSLGKKVRSAYS